jgi:8-oxo-dGTP pyrophosphatase MutT (NUDIX family)
VTLPIEFGPLDSAPVDAAVPTRDGLLRALASFSREAQPLERRKAAAVAIVVIESAGVVLTKRAGRLRAHPGQWALPGGRLDPGETAVEAARRELREELGLAADEAAVAGILDDHPTRSGYVITPVVMWVPDRFADLTPNPQEVASVHLATWQMLAVDPIFLRIPESEAPVIQLPILGTLIHAPTAALLYQFRELALHRRTTRVSGLEQPVWAWR